MWVVLAALLLVGSPAEKPATPPRKGAPAQPKKRRTTPTPLPPSGPKMPDKTKTAMA
jgi:hypothetical protein